MRFFSIAWQIFAGLATGAVVIAMFQIAGSPFETIVVSALVLIYVSVIGSYKVLGYALSKKWRLDSTRYTTIAKSLRFNTEIEEQALKEDEESDEKAQAAYWISAGFDMLFGLIAMSYLLYAIAKHTGFLS